MNHPVETSVQYKAMQLQSMNSEKLFGKFITSDDVSLQESHIWRDYGSVQATDISFSENFAGVHSTQWRLMPFRNQKFC